VKPKIDLKEKNLGKIKKFNNIGSSYKKKYKNMSLQKFLPLSEAEIQGVLYLAEVNLGLFFV
jgi:hypothetical protein